MVTDRPFCFSCGDELTGLDLPHQCPECGEHVDPKQQAAMARNWLASRRAWWWLLCGRSMLPPGLLYCGHDTALIRKGRRRIFFMLWFPALLSVLVIAAGTCVLVEYDVRLWYYDRSDPDRKPLRVVNGKDTDRPYNLNLHLFRDFFFSPPANWESVEERHRRYVRLVWPPHLDQFAIRSAGFVWLMLLFGYLPCCGLLATLAKRTATQRGRSELRSSMRTARRMLIVPAGVAAWLWLALVILAGVLTIHAEVPISAHLMDVLLLMTCAPGLAVIVIGWWRFVGLDRGRVFFTSPLCVAALLVGISLAGPATAAMVGNWIITILWP